MNRSVLFLFFLIGLAVIGRAQQFPGATQLPGGFGQGGFGQTTSPGSATGGSFGGIDDSTRVIYGPKTTRYILEDDIFNNRKKLYTMDTTMDDAHRFLYVQRAQNLYQDLGNLGTPMRNVFVPVPQQLGAQTGYSVFSPYAYQTMQVKYFNTKSPFTDMYLALGGRNQNILRFDFAQNITPRWNVGFNAQRFTSQKQFGTSGANDPTKLLAQNWGFLGHTNYQSKNEKYTLLAHFINMNHSVEEQGGVLPGTNLDGSRNDYAYTGDALLTNGSASATSSALGPRGNEIRNDWHIYHQYVLDQGFQIYQRLDYNRHKNSYHDEYLQANYAFYPTILGDTSTVYQDARFRLVENQFGLKGIYDRRGSAFNYRAYLRNRIYGQYTRYNTSGANENEYETRRTETFLGGWLGYYFPDSLSQVTAEAEYQVGGGYRLQGQFESKYLTAGYSSIFANPTLLQERFQSHIFFWRNNFNLRGYNHAYGKLNLRYKKLLIQPGIDYYLLSNYIYFDTAAVVRQLNGSFSVLRTGLGYHFEVGKFLASGQAYYTVQSRRDVLRTPPFFMNARFQYELLYAKVLYIQIGVDLHYKSPYYADAYMPVTQQFYVQNEKKVEGYVLADLFANLRVNRTRLFVKLTHANQGVFQPGYFVAPDYLAMRRSFAFGVDWYLFD
ncbi:putative porin [Spirosoma oryzicola]|uniref:putative porin n=1 Tax=Spirosoma oryzicola TaxID=2898794 RepID=UPI001E4AE639|nr:putative porin [Spirosoma oryzicola]UHG89537.1 putative porin [Spirosoma oryzicola]